MCCFLMMLTLCDNELRPSLSAAENDETTPSDKPAPTITKTYPKEGEKVDSGTLILKFRFSENMSNAETTPDEIEGLTFPELQEAPYFRKPNELFMKVTLESEKQYALGFNQGNERFKTPDGRPVEPFVLKFNTKRDNSNIYGWSEMCDKELANDEALLNLLAHENDKITVNSEFTLTQTVVDSGNGINTRNVTEHTAKSTHADTILGISNHQFRKIQREYGNVYIQTVVKGSMLEQKPFVAVEPVSGKTYIIEWTGASCEITCDGGPVGNEERDKVKYEMTIPDFLPRDKIVKKGDTFEPEGKWFGVIAAVICKLGVIAPESGTSKITVDSVTYVEDAKTKLVRFSMQAQIKGKWGATGAPGSIDFECVISMDATDGKIIGVIMTGKGKFTGQADPITGITKSMEIETHLTVKWDYETVKPKTGGN